MENEQFIKDITSRCEQQGFENDRGWEQPDKKGLHHYSFGKGNYRFEINLNWNKSYTHYEPLLITFLDCSKEYRGEPLNFHGWMGQSRLHKFTKPISRSMFDALCEHYGLNN